MLLIQSFFSLILVLSFLYISEFCTDFPSSSKGFKSDLRKRRVREREMVIKRNTLISNTRSKEREREKTLKDCLFVCLFNHQNNFLRLVMKSLCGISFLPTCINIYWISFNWHYYQKLYRHNIMFTNIILFTFVLWCFCSLDN